MPDGTMRFPPGVGDGPKGDPNSAEKVRARRMRAERQFKELQGRGEDIPEEMAKTLYDLGSDIAPGGTIWATLAGAAPAAGGAPPRRQLRPRAATAWLPAGDRHGARATRTRPRRCAPAACGRSGVRARPRPPVSPSPDDVMATIHELGGPLCRRRRRLMATEVLWWIFADRRSWRVSAGVVFSRSVIHSAIFLIGSLAGVGAMYLFLTVEFLALVQFLIYGGAVTVLILLALMLTRMGATGGTRRR